MGIDLKLPQVIKRDQVCCFKWYIPLLVSNLSRITSYSAYNALYNTSVKIEYSINDEKILDIVFDKPRIQHIPYNDERRECIEKLAKSYTIEVYIPDALGIYLPENVPCDNIILEKGIYLLVYRIIDEWKYRASKYGLFNVNTLLSLVFYHEYLHMMLDELGAGYLKSTNPVLKTCCEELKYTDCEEVLCEFYALTKTLQNTLLDYIWNNDLAYRICNPLEKINVNVKHEDAYEKHELSVEEHSAYQPTTTFKFLNLDRPTPYSYVKNLWNDYLTSDLVKFLTMTLAVFDSKLGCKGNILEPWSVEPLKVIGRVTSGDIHKYFYEKILDVLYKIYRGRRGVECIKKKVDTNVFLVGISEDDLIDICFNCSELM